MHPVEKRTLMTKGDILSKLPQTNNSRNFDRAISFYTCQYDECNTACTSTTLGYCLDHFVELYRNYSLEIPTSEDIRIFHYKMDRQRQVLHNGSNVSQKQNGTTMFHRTDTRNCAHNPKLPSTKGACQKHAENTYFVLNLNQGQDDIIESAAPPSESSRRNSKHNDRLLVPKRCIGPVCYNYGQTYFNGLCETCYNILLHNRGDSQIHESKQNVSIVSSSQISVQTLPDLDLKLSEELQDLNLSENNIDPTSHVLDFNESQNEKSMQSVEVVPCETRYIEVPTNHRPVANVYSQHNVQPCQHHTQPSKHLNYEQPWYAMASSQDLAQRQLADMTIQHQQQLPHQTPSVHHNHFSGCYQETNRSTRYGNQNHSGAKTESYKSEFDFKEVAKTIEEHSRQSLKKCKQLQCSNYGNSQCQGYCNSCYKTLK